MDIGNFIIYFVVFLICSPVLVLLHELGHALIALMLTHEDVYIYLGNAKLNKKIRIGKLVLKINGYLSIMDLTYGCIEAKRIDSKIGYSLMLIGGPFTSLLISCFTIWILQTNLHSIVRTIFSALFMLSASQFVMTILPVKYTSGSYIGFTSDGLKMALIWKK